MTASDLEQTPPIAAGWFSAYPLWLRISLALFFAVVGYAVVYPGDASLSWVGYVVVGAWAVMGFFYPNVRENRFKTWLVRRL